MEILQGLKPDIHVFICTNDRTRFSDAKPSCGPLITDDLVKELKVWSRSQNFNKRVQITKTGCLGGCNKEGGVVVTYPDGRFFKGFKNIEDFKKFILQIASQ